LDNVPGYPHSLENLYPEIKVVYASKYLLWYSAYGSDSHSYLQAVLHKVNNQPGYKGNWQGRWTYLEGILKSL
jgi:hypothetical protein